MFDFVGWYFSSLAEFWGSAVRIGLPQILLVVLLICWLRRRGCGKSRGTTCCWGWWGGSSGARDDADCCPESACKRPCGCWCRDSGGACETDANGDDED